MAQKHPKLFDAYLALVCLLSIPAIWDCFSNGGPLDYRWIILVLCSVPAAIATIRLPKISSVISMCDVFVFLAILKLGPGPALVLYWVDITTTSISDAWRRNGRKGGIVLHRYLFNLAACALSVFVMSRASVYVSTFPLSSPQLFLINLLVMALAWFAMNSLTLSTAVSLRMGKRWIDVWSEGARLYLLNFIASASAAGLVIVLSDRMGFLIFSLSIPLVVVLYQTYSYHLKRYEDAQRYIADLNRFSMQTIEALASAIEAKDRYTHGHTRRVQAYVDELARCMGVSQEEELVALKAGALLHDVGKLAIPEYILNKPTVLTENEYQRMKIHPLVGAEMLRGISFPYPVVPLVRSHHERWDGNGYPDGLREQQIPLGARILSLIDCFDALTTNRPYRSPMSREEIVEYFSRESGRAYDPEVVSVFIKNIERIEQAGAQVELPTASAWETYESQPSSLRPLERVQPTLSYGRVLSSEASVQADLFSAFEFARAVTRSMNHEDVLTFMSRRLSNMASFDLAVFFLANLEDGCLEAKLSIGKGSDRLQGLALPLEKKLSGWVATNNQALRNLPPSPDFISLPEPRPKFETSAIVPLNHAGQVFGAISLYRESNTRFSEDEFRRLELLAAQTAVAISRVTKGNRARPVLVDDSTGLPNEFQLTMLFEQVASDAIRFGYPVSVCSIKLAGFAEIRRWDPESSDRCLRMAIKAIRARLGEEDVLCRCADDHLAIVLPHLNYHDADLLQARLDECFEQFQLKPLVGDVVTLRPVIGLASFPEDGTVVASLLDVALSRARQGQRTLERPTVASQ